MGTDAANRVPMRLDSEGIAVRILAALREAEGAAVSPFTAESLAPLDHIQSRGIKATGEIVRLLDPQPHDHLLDIGGGLGGPARWIAARYGCHVTSLDRSLAFCRTAVDLNAVTGLSGRVQVVTASATALPFSDAAFDGAYSQHVAMTMEDKRGFFAEAFRVLRPGGIFAFSQYGAGARGEPSYPLPWADGPDTTFLCSPGETQMQAVAAGFELVWFHDRTREILPDLRESRRQLEGDGLPPFGLRSLLGERSRDRQINVARSTEEGRLTFMEAVLRKPARNSLAQAVPLSVPHGALMLEQVCGVAG
jgi:SAM-dependent methyltransferase